MTVWVPNHNEANHNPCNLRDEGIPWQGLVGADSRGLCIFDTDFHGLRAGARDIFVKWYRDGLRTVADIIGKYAPPQGPDHNDTAAYIVYVVNYLNNAPAYIKARLAPGVLNISAVTKLLLSDAEALLWFLKAVIGEEEGRIIYGDDLILSAVQAALE